MAGENRQVAVSALRKREADVLYAFVLMFTFGQLGLIVWDMLAMVGGFAALTAFVGMPDPGRIHSFGEMTTLYLGLVGAYIGRNAWQKYRKGDDAGEVPHYVFIGMKRGHFFMALWATVCFIAYMLKGMGVIGRLPQELTITTLGVLGGLVGDKAVRGYLGRRAARQMEAADAAGSAGNHKDAVMAYFEKEGRLTNMQLRILTGLKDSQATAVLQQLEQEGKLEQVGQGRYAYYRKKGTSA